MFAGAGTSLMSLSQLEVDIVSLLSELSKKMLCYDK